MPMTPLIDERVVAQTFALRRRVGAVEPLCDDPLVPDSQAYGSVLRDARGVWRMWYLAPPVYSAYYATSQDGLRWQRPDLDLVPPEARANASGPNLVMTAGCRDAAGRWLVETKGPEGFCVLDAETTPHPAAQRRFTALYLARHESYGPRANGLCLAHSDDGLVWYADPANPILPGWRDTAPALLYDPRRRAYVLYTRPHVHVRLVSECNRAVARLESPDLYRWAPEQLVLDTDDLDAPADEFLDESFLRTGSVLDARQRAAAWREITEGAVTGNDRPLIRGRNQQWYGLAPWLAGDLYLGLGWRYNLPSGEIYMELLHSFDGIDWRRDVARECFLGGPGGVTAVTMSSPPITVGDQHRIYWSHSDRNHHHRVQPVTKGVRVAGLVRDRWVGYGAVTQTGELLTAATAWQGELRLNAEVSPGGWVQAEWLTAEGEPLPGYELAASDRLTRGGLDLVLRWQGRPAAATGVLTRLRLVVQRATLYALGT